VRISGPATRDTLNQFTIDWFKVQHPVGHNNCTASACTRNNIDTSTYQQLYSFEGYHCTPRIPDVELVKRLLDVGEMPVMRLLYHDEKPQLAVVPMLKGEKEDYVAISHVWVDGLRSQMETGLLQCQLVRMAELASKAMGRSSDAMYFWIDSLCIPRSTNAISYKALEGIRDVYLCTSTVVDVDKFIQQCSRSDSTENYYAHIYMSA
jgi:hypothetical protein